MEAAENCVIDVIKTLASSGVDINAHINHPVSVLNFACCIK